MRISLVISPKGFQFSRFKTVTNPSTDTLCTQDTKCPGQAYTKYSPGHIRALHLVSLTFGTCIHLYRLAMLFLSLILSTTLLCLQLIRPLKILPLIESLHDQLCIFQQARAQNNHYISNIIARLKESSKSTSYNDWIRYLYEGTHIWQQTHALSERYTSQYKPISKNAQGKRPIDKPSSHSISQGEQCMNIFLHLSRYLIDCFVVLCCIFSMAVSAGIGLFLPNNGRKLYANFEKIAYTGGIEFSTTIEPPHSDLQDDRRQQSADCSSNMHQTQSLSHILPSRRRRPHYVAHFFQPVEVSYRRDQRPPMKRYSNSNI